MKGRTAVVVALAAAALAPLAAAQVDHPPCGEGGSVSTGNALSFLEAGVEVWGNPSCIGAGVWAESTIFACNGSDVHRAGLHVLVLVDDSCGTGALWELP